MAVFRTFMRRLYFLLSLHQLRRFERLPIVSNLGDADSGVVLPVPTQLLVLFLALVMEDKNFVSASLLDNLAGPVLGNYAELDRNLTGQTPAIISGLLSRQKTFGLHIYQGVNHAFHDDTGPAFDPAAACDAWGRTVAWFDKFLKSKMATA